ncbi:Proteasome_subunit beta type [Hexamita inflata]|uniref:Proteasome subunit beta n=1 Tax=Hexamita inflata TaxID=28002 RepID=A0AA86NS28_9EUKA|nr:Proteasome subunit beta type [Hexamita inflata]CAI9944921.1 Proteasome subunit beta type [Hexamita inflata]
MSDDEQFNPYVDNGGTCIAIAGKDFVLIGSDTRCSDGGYQILSRTLPKAHKITDKVMLASSGMKADADYLLKTLRNDADEYAYKTGKEISVAQFSRLVSVSLYRRRFFPWYTFNIVGGLDEQGRGRIFSYDAVGSSGEYQYTSTGSGESLAIGILDNELMPLITEERLDSLTIEGAKKLAIAAMEAVTEREIKTGDDFQYYIITKDGIQEFHHGLRRD